MGRVARTLSVFQMSWPIVAAMLSQSLMTLVDTALVGPLGAQALAAVGAGSYANLFALALIAGLTPAVQAQVAFHTGREQHQRCWTPVIQGVALSLMAVLPLSVVLMLSGGWFFDHFDLASDGFQQEASSYFQIRVLALTAAALNLTFRGFWNGLGEPLQFLKWLVFTHLCNVLISAVLIYGLLGLPALGVDGAALGTLIAMHLGALFNGMQLWQRRKLHACEEPWYRKLDLRPLLRLVLPESLQQTLFALSLWILFYLLAYQGVEAAAMSSVLLNLSALMILPARGIGMAVGAIVSRSLGAEHATAAWHWGFDGLRLAMVAMLLLCLLVALFAEPLLQLFLHDDQLLQHAVVPLRIIALSVWLDTPSLILTQALLGVGAVSRVLAVRVFGQWVVLLPLCTLLGPVLGLPFVWLWWAFVVQRFCCSGITLWQWRKKPVYHVVI